MIDYVSTKTFESVALPGVRFTLRKMSEARRAQVRLQVAEPMHRIRQYLAEQSRIDKQPEDQRDVARKAQLEDLIECEVLGTLNPIYLRWGLSSVENLSIDGTPATVESLLEDGNSDLVAEILLTIKAVMGLSEEELKNFVLPSTSGAGTDGSGPSSTVTSASAAEAFDAATAENISPSL